MLLLRPGGKIGCTQVARKRCKVEHDSMTPRLLIILISHTKIPNHVGTLLQVKELLGTLVFTC
jgi:hypothetical protein